MIKKISIVLLSVMTVFCSVSYAAKVQKKNIFIKPFTVDGKGVSMDFTDYMSEVIVEYEEYNLISEEDVSAQKSAIEGKMASSSSDVDNDASMKALMEAVDSDSIIFGTIDKNDDGSLTVMGRILDRKTGIGKGKTIKVKRARYLDIAARALAHYLITKKDSYLDELKEDMEDKEKGVAKAEKKRRNTLLGIESDFEGQNETVAKSPFIRVGYSGIGGSSYINDKKVNEYYPKAQVLSADLFVYRSRDIVGDGVDIYSKFMYKKFSSDDASVEKFKTDMTALNLTTNNEKLAGQYLIPSGNTLKELEMIQKSIDIGFRFVGTSYFLNEAWSLYMMFGGRYMQVTETYKTTNSMLLPEDFKKNFTGIGGVAGLGLEVTINRYMGLFAEVNAGYVPIGDNKLNYDGYQLIVGATLRNSHTEYPFLGIL